MNTENRRNITPEYLNAVKDGLRRAGSKQDAMTVAKLMWTNETLHYRLPYDREASTVKNPHKDGGAVESLAATVERMYRRG